MYYSLNVNDHNDTWMSKRPKSETQLFVAKLVQTNNRKILNTYPLWGKSIGDWWIPQMVGGAENISMSWRHHKRYKPKVHHIRSQEKQTTAIRKLKEALKIRQSKKNQRSRKRRVVTWMVRGMKAHVIQCLLCTENFVGLPIIAEHIHKCNFNCPV